MAVDAGNGFALAPARAAIRGTEYVDAAALERHNHSAVRLHYGLAANPTCMGRGGQTRTPGLPAVAGNAHQNIAAAVSLIPFGVAIAVVETGWCVVAHTPVLVVEVGFVDVNGISPMQAIRGAAHRDIADQPRTAAQADQRQRRDQPLSVLIVHGETRQVSILPGYAAIGGSRKPTSALPQPIDPGLRPT